MNQLLTIQISLVIIGLIGAIDEYLFHYKKVDLTKQIECEKENILHTLRQFIFAFIFITTAYADVNGWFTFYIIALLLLDILIGFADVIVEPRSREKLGGLPAGEYFLHMLLSFALGIFHFNYIELLLIKSSNTPSVNLGHTSHFMPEFILATMGFVSLLISARGLHHLLRSQKN